ncbi:ribosomal protein S18 acetylase RimI-like enzyme [Paucimonas lemoignei]|uniref:Ribosomal protein S18 acetylase RimI-like enzyme n=2 Tax=Paucimonas lemoignei TaxID=29443 RepID=A0A4R3HVF1_PAULE|nr:ribosomal protein S18 acetylase RimI-like enzyme [Paucimonas lemoignei]
MRYSVRIMRPQDIPSVLRIQAECYAPAMVEDESTIRRRHEIAPDTAWVAEDEEGISAYLVAYRSSLGKITRLGGNFENSAAPNCLYFHDLAVAGRFRGQGAAGALAEFAWNEAQQDGLAYSSLVSVQDSRAYWEALGYRAYQELAQAQQANLNSYPGPAWYMVKSLAGLTGAATL